MTSFLRPKKNKAFPNLTLKRLFRKNTGAVALTPAQCKANGPSG